MTTRGTSAVADPMPWGGQGARRGLLVALMVPLLAVLGLVPAGAARDRFPVQVQDDTGRLVTIPRRPERLISLSPAHTETLFALGAGPRLVAVDSYSDHPPAVRKLKGPRIHSWPQPPLETLVALKPDLVVVLTEEREFAEKLAKFGIPVLKFFPADLPSAYRRIRDLGRAIDAPEEAVRLAARLQKRIEAVGRRVAAQPRRSFLMEIDGSDPARPFVAGGRGLYHELLVAAGGRNLFEETREPAVQVSAEQIIHRQPDVILIGLGGSNDLQQAREKLRSRPGWQDLRAVKGHRVFSVRSASLTRPGPRMADAVEEAARYLHPEVKF